ncbi:MAG: hypothetical protein IJT79_07635 [Ruminococcus sp.]|nr:hypothetical protein [Ruminococcus sp.]MBR0469883.1 hypothetical protein [Clostridia bacterium]
MKLLPGFKLVELTEDRIVQEHEFDNGQIIVHGRHIGNPNPPPEEHQRLINEVAIILLKGRQRRLMEEQEKVGA